MQQPMDWVALIVAFVVGVAMGAGLVYLFRQHELLEIVRLKGELLAERALLWDELRQRNEIGVKNPATRPTKA